MHSFLRFVAIVAVLHGYTVRAQSANANTSAQADKAWVDLVALSRVPASARIRAIGDKGNDEIKGRIRQQAEQSAQVAQTAKAFYTQYPFHTKALEARKLEAISAVHSVVPNDAARERAALATATAFRNDRNAPGNDRCEVALAMNRYQLSRQFKSKAVNDTAAERLKVADNLQKEFGDVAALQGYRLELARRAERSVASEIAATIIRSPVATAKMKAEAQTIIERASLVGKVVSLKLTKIDGGEVDLAQQQNKVVALIVWSPADFARLADLNAIARQIRPDVQIVYMGLGGTKSQVVAGSSALPLPGVSCYAPTPAAGRSFAAAVKLQYAPAPYAYVLDRTGKVAGSGRLDELPGLIAKATR